MFDVLVCLLRYVDNVILTFAGAQEPGHYNKALPVAGTVLAGAGSKGKKAVIGVNIHIKCKVAYLTPLTDKGLPKFRAWIWAIVEETWGSNGVSHGKDTPDAFHI